MPIPLRADYDAAFVLLRARAGTPDRPDDR